jgi:hypothetical protein
MEASGFFETLVLSAKLYGVISQKTTISVLGRKYDTDFRSNVSINTMKLVL